MQAGFDNPDYDQGNPDYDQATSLFGKVQPCAPTNDFAYRVEPIFSR
jgi:hypothetical protein